MTTSEFNVVVEPSRPRSWRGRRVAAALAAFVFVGLSAFLVVPMWLLLVPQPCGGGPRSSRAYREARELEHAIERYVLEKTRCPERWDDLVTAGILRRLDGSDPWGHPYMFLCREDHSPPVVVCSFGHEREAKGGVCSDGQYPAR